MYTFSSIGDWSVPKCVKCTHSAAKKHWPKRRKAPKVAARRRLRSAPSAADKGRKPAKELQHKVEAERVVKALASTNSALSRTRVSEDPPKRQALRRLPEAKTCVAICSRKTICSRSLTCRWHPRAAKGSMHSASARKIAASAQRRKRTSSVYRGSETRRLVHCWDNIKDYIYTPYWV